MIALKYVNNNNNVTRVLWNSSTMKLLGFVTCFYFQRHGWIGKWDTDEIDIGNYVGHVMKLSK